MSPEDHNSDLANELKEIKEALRRSDRLLTTHRFAGSLMHEVNNPLEALVNLVYIAKTISTEVRVQEIMAVAETQLTRLGEMTRKSLSFYRDEQQSHEVDVIDIVESALSIHRHRLRDQKVELHKRFRQPARALVLPGEILQVLSNLILNALDAMPAEQAILHVRVRSCPVRVHITIADNGAGMEPSIYKNLFQANKSTKAQGTGFGLWLCKSVIDKHGGSILCRSSQKPSHQGTTFRVCVPINGAATAA